MKYFKRHQSSKILMYELKREYMKPTREGERRFFRAFIMGDVDSSESSEVFINFDQSAMPTNPSIPLGAWEELKGIVDDWRETNAISHP